MTELSEEVRAGRQDAVPAIASNWLRRLLCLEPVEARVPEPNPRGLALLDGKELVAWTLRKASRAKTKEPQTLRQALYPLTLLFTVCYMALECREFWLPGHPRPASFSPELYEGLLGVFAGEQELRRWSGKPDRYVLAGEFIIYAWWLLYLVMAMAASFNPGLGLRMPREMRGTCVAVMAVLLGLRASKFFHKRRGAGGAFGGGYSGAADGAIKDRYEEDQVLAYVREHGRITSRECAELLGMSYRHAQRVLSGMVEARALEHDGDKNSGDVGYRIPTMASDGLQG